MYARFTDASKETYIHTMFIAASCVCHYTYSALSNITAATSAGNVSCLFFPSIASVTYTHIPMGDNHQETTADTGEAISLSVNGDERGTVGLAAGCDFAAARSAGANGKIVREFTGRNKQPIDDTRQTAAYQ